MNELKSLHPALKFTTELECTNCLPFLDVLVERSASSFTTSIYRKPTFTGQYTRWDSFSSTRYKIGLINVLVSRAKRICSNSKFHTEMDKIAGILSENGYPEDIIRSFTHKFLTAIDERKMGPEKCPVYIKIPWKGKMSQRYEEQIKRCVSNTSSCSSKSDFHLSTFDSCI